MTLEKPRFLSPCKFTISKSGDDCYHIDIDGHQIRIDSALDFDRNMFMNSLEWYDRGTWRVIFQKHDNMVQLDRVLLEILKGKEQRSISKIESHYDGEEDSEMIYQKLFFDPPEFSSEILGAYKNTAALENIKVGKPIPMFSLEEIKTLTIKNGEIALSTQFKYCIVSK